MGPCAAVAQQPAPTATQPNEYTVKAVFLYSFGRYVQWPQAAFAKPDDPFIIGIAGDDTFDGALDQIASKKTIQGRRIVIARFATSDTYRPCHILFLSRSLPAAQVDALIDGTRGKGVLVVGESPGTAERGAAANFFIEDGRVRLEINPIAARTSHLEMDAKLLALGKPVTSH